MTHKKSIKAICFALLIPVFSIGQNIYPPSGNVGIGSTSPSAKLHIVDTGNSGVTTLQLNNRVKFRGDGVINWGASADYGILSWDTGKTVVGGQSGKDLSLLAGASEKMIIKTNGNVSIGSTSPSAKLHIVDAGNSGVTTLQLNNRVKFRGDGVINWGASADYGILSWDTGKTVVGGQSGKDLSLLAGASEKMIIKTNGNVSIGSTNPSAKLHIVDAGNSGVTTLQLNNRVKFRGDGVINWGASADYGILSWDTGKTVVGGQSGKDLSLLAGASEKMIVKTNGNVGIGTTTPNSKLSVAGEIHSKEVKVSVNVGADFVFEDDYKLPSLEFVEKYVRKNNHLPEIASAKDMKENGIHLSEMSIKLLQKIEELTLYAIQQENKFKKQEKTNKELQEQLARIETLLTKNNLTK